LSFSKSDEYHAWVTHLFIRKYNLNLSLWFLPLPNLEAGILFALQLPLLIFKEKGVSGGVFDNGVTDVFVHNLPKSNMTTEEEESLRAVFLKWQAKVRQHYYAWATELAIMTVQTQVSILKVLANATKETGNGLNQQVV